MNEHRFHLEKYHRDNRYECPSCGRKRCFTRYIDEQREIVFPDNVGRCNHEDNCGYYYTPRDYFRDNPNCLPEKSLQSELPSHYPSPMPMKSQQEPSPSFIDNAIVEKTLSHYDINPLFLFLCKVMGKEEAKSLFLRYRVGTSKEWGGSTVFWQTDINGGVRSGKIMRYDPDTGHRVKGEVDRITWVHSKLHLRDFNLRQCFFGEHLLSIYPNKTVAIVESEKTALIASHFIKDTLWIATGGKHGCLNERAVSVLRDRRVMLCPDLGAEEVWRSKLPILSSVCHSVTISDLLENEATEEQRQKGFDIADFLLMEDTPQMMLQKLIYRYPAIQSLMDALDLEIIE